MQISVTFTDESSVSLDLDSGDNLALTLARVYAQLAGHTVDQIATVHVADGERTFSARLRSTVPAGPRHTGLSGAANHPR